MPKYKVVLEKVVTYFDVIDDIEAAHDLEARRIALKLIKEMEAEGKRVFTDFDKPIYRAEVKHD